MSNPRLPVETLDYIVDHLHDTQDALRNCCLVSKSWIPRTRKHLFANVRFPTEKCIESWKKKFPDPSTSPACYAKALFVDCPRAITAGSWLRGFSRVEHLEVNVRLRDFSSDGSTTLLVPFHGFSHVIKSLRMTVPVLLPSPAANLILSFPLLEDLAVTTSYGTSGDGSYGSNRLLTVAQPSNPRMFTGTLELNLGRQMKHFIRLLLSLPGGIHFRGLTLKWRHDGTHLPTTALVEGCSRTLEFFDLACKQCAASVRHPCPRR
jgi:hypothetical protein